MGKIYIFKKGNLKAKKQTIKFLLDFSKSLETITVGTKKFSVAKN
ncbi:hypothetical protein [Bergeyella cardium]|nr:hypothetical protein [Bergeyella cardium]WHE32976.1 hypothetical protein P8603_05615 [Bergeyella cardium]WHF59628.1 hypothetical protein O0R51_05610 [Bergeyella cardium]